MFCLNEFSIISIVIDVNYFNFIKCFCISIIGLSNSDMGMVIGIIFNY